MIRLLISADASHAFASDSWIRLVDSMLIHVAGATLFGSLLGLAAIAAVSLIQPMSAALRHFVLMLAMIAPLGLPLADRIVPRWSILPADLSISALLANPASTGLESTRPNASITRSKHSERTPDVSSRHGSDFAGPISDFAKPTVDVRRSSDPTGLAITALAIVWLVGLAGSLTVYAAGLVSLWLLGWRGDTCKDPNLNRLLGSAKQRVGIRRNIRLILSDQRTMPMQWGTVRPIILLPREAAGWDDGIVESAFLHELAHVRRLDFLCNAAVYFARSVFWFNPLVWWISLRMHREREQACDDMLISGGVDACDYADALLHVAKSVRAARCVTATAMCMSLPRSELSVRVTAILDVNRNRDAMSVRTAGRLIAIFSIVLFLGSALRCQEAIATRSVQADRELERDHQPSELVRVGYVDNVAEGKRSIAGSGHAIAFRRPDSAHRVAAIEIFASRYGTVDPPNEDFHVYLLDAKQRLIAAYPFPYSMIDRGNERWYTLAIDERKVPAKFHVALAFDPHRTKGVYLGFDENVRRTHSSTGRPTTGFQTLDEKRDWMIRAVMVSERQPTNPFESSQ